MKISDKIKLKFSAVVLLAVLILVLSYPPTVSFFPFLYQKINSLKINLGLDLQGGIHLEYKADTSAIPEDKKEEAMQAIQDLVERRVNAFGIGEPLVQTSFSGGENRVIVELPGIKNMEEAKKTIKDTPFLEFKEEVSEEELKDNPVIKNLNEQSLKNAQAILAKVLAGENFEEAAKNNSQDPGSREKGGDLDFSKKGKFVPEFEAVLFNNEFKNGEIYPELVETQFGWHIIKKIEERGEGDEREVRGEHILFTKVTADMLPDLKYKATGLTGKNLKNAEVIFQSQGLSEPQVSLKFDSEGTALFAELTKRNVGKTIAIYLDGKIISAPVVQTEINNGEAVITGNFSIEEANELKRRLNEGALPVPIELVSQQSVEASLGAQSLKTGLRAGVIGLFSVIIFMLLYYRFLGFVASLALLLYAGMMVSIFKLSGFLSPWPITLTLSGIAGFVLSVGMAVDANVLIFERIKEELRKGKNLKSALDTGFKRAWPSIRDGNLSTILTSLILIWFSSGFVQGFAVILIIGVLVSMFTAIVLTKSILNFLLMSDWLEKRIWLVIKR